jgi:hypothetical protein
VLYDRLKGDAGGVRAHLGGEVSWQNRMARFLENHDEERSVAAYGRERIPALMVLIATLPGLRFFHQGQFEGYSMHLPMPLNAAKPETADAGLKAEYEKLLRLTHDPAFHDGDWQLLDVTPDSDGSNASLLAWRWKRGDAYRLVIVNLGGGTAQGRVWIAHEVPGARALELTDALTGEAYDRSCADLEAHGLYVRLDAHRAHLFDVTA